MFKLIAFHGHKQSGKSTAAAVTRTILNGQRRSFATPIYTALSNITGLSIAQLKSKRYKEKNLPGLNCTARRALQTLGTEWGRVLVDPNIWLHPMDEAIKAARVLDLPIIIDDCRFINEADFIHEYNGIVVKIYSRRTELQAIDNHASEIVLPENQIDYVLSNHGSIEEYKKDIATLIQSI